MTEAKKKNHNILSVLIFFLVAAILVFGLKTAYSLWEDSQVDTNTLVYDALDNINAWDSYRYNLDAMLMLNNYKTAESVISGESDREGNLHIFGEIMDTEMEAYQFGDTHYRFNAASKKWVVLENSPLTTNAVLLMQIEPILNFDFSDTLSVTYEGKERVNGKKLYEFTVVPQEGFHIADTYFTDFTYKIGIDGKTKQINEAVIDAVSQTDSENQLEVIVRFFDINADFVLTPPSN